MMRDRTPHGTMSRFVFATLLVALGTPPLAAAIDLSGDYVTSGLTPCRLSVVQTGTALQVGGSCSVGSTTSPISLAGTVDPGTGAFSVTGEIPGLCADLACSGTGDGEETQITCTSSSSACNVPLSATKCGNGVIDPEENCEDGNHADGDCCSARCRLDPAGTACTSDGNDCTADVCDAAGTCTHVTVPPAECWRAAACHSTCTQQLKECRQACRGRGQARRDCREACAERSTCTAPGARIRALAYVVSECTTDAQGRSSLEQKLLIRRGNCDPLQVMEARASTPVPNSFGLCRALGFPLSGGHSFISFGVLQAMAVVPDGSGVVFDVTKQFSPALTPEPPGEGIFFVRADGSGLRRLGPPSRFQFFLGQFSWPVSPDGRTIAFIDLGPSTAG